MDAHNERYTAYSQWGNTLGLLGALVMMSVFSVVGALFILIVATAPFSMLGALLPLLVLVGLITGIGWAIRAVSRMEPVELVLLPRCVEWYGERVPYDTIVSIEGTWSGADITLDDGSVRSTGGRVLKQPERFVEALGVRVSQARAGEERPGERRRLEALHALRC